MLTALKGSQFYFNNQSAYAKPNTPLISLHRYLHSLLVLNPKFQASSMLCDCTGWFISDLFRIKGCLFSHAKVHYLKQFVFDITAVKDKIMVSLEQHDISASRQAFGQKLNTIGFQIMKVKFTHFSSSAPYDPSSVCHFCMSAFNFLHDTYCFTWKCLETDKQSW